MYQFLPADIRHGSLCSKEVENLGNVVNTQYSEARPTISADGKLLYFIVESNPKNTMSKRISIQDIWYSELGGNGQWGAPSRHPP